MAAKQQAQTMHHKYDVFLSFRGADTRKGFTDHLYTALVRAGIHTFRDDNEIRDGEEIGPECLKAIEESRLSIVVLSKGYASSPWCLDELVHILECRTRMGHGVRPVFYHLDPADVEEQTGSFAEAFAQHQTRFKDDMEKVERWKAALTQVSYLKGLDLQRHEDGHDARNVDNIVKEILRKLDRLRLTVASYPVGLHSRAKDVISLLNKSVDVCIVGIYGMGGIGKTTLAKEVYNALFEEFEGCCFLENVIEKSDAKGIAKLQRQLLSEILKQKYDKIYNIDHGVRVIQERLCHKKVLLVLDNVDDGDELNKILGDQGWLFPGSRVIITSRNKGVLNKHILFYPYEVQKLDDKDALQLLSLHAFMKLHPPQDYMECSRDAVHYAQGLPLALEVLGSSFCGQGVDEWNSRLKKLKVVADTKIQRALEISYESLDDVEKFLFLDIACFFVGKNKGYVMSILEDCGLFPTAGINTLIKRYLVTVVDDRLWMHDLLRDMGREIVRRESPLEPGERSRIWSDEDAFDILIDQTGTKAVEGLMLNLRSPSDGLSTKALKKLKKLRLLQLNHVCLRGSCEHFSKKLRMLCWRAFSMDSIPAELHLGNLVALDIRYSSLKQFSGEMKLLPKLKFLNLGHSKELTTTPNFEGIRNLERLILKNCISLTEIHDSIGLLKRLVLLNLQECKSLTKLPPTIGTATSIENLNISGCTKLEELPLELGDMKSLVVLNADGTAITSLPETTGNLENLKNLSLVNCRLLFSPYKGPQFIKVLPVSLVHLNLSYCNITEDAIPCDLQGLPSLTILKLCGNNFTTLPDSIGGLPMLKELWLDECGKLQSVPMLQSSVSLLNTTNCFSLETINLSNYRGNGLSLEGCHNLKELSGFFNFETVGSETVENLLRNCDLSITQESAGGANYVHMFNALTSTHKKSPTPIQALCERGIYSIFLPGSEIPGCFSYQGVGDSISFQIPPLEPSSKIIGFAIVAIYAWEKSCTSCFFCPNFTLIDKTKAFNWSYDSKVAFFSSEADGDMMWLSHWIFEKQFMWDCLDGADTRWMFWNEMGEGDEMEVLIDFGFRIMVRKCGLRIIYQSNEELAAVSLATSRHRRSILKSYPRWLTMNNHKEITGEFYYQIPPQEWDNMKRWSAKVEDRMHLRGKFDRRPHLSSSMPI